MYRSFDHESLTHDVSSFSVPPDKPLIRASDGQEYHTHEIGPYEVDQDLNLDCEVTGGEFGDISVPSNK